MELCVSDMLIVISKLLNIMHKDELLLNTEK